MDKLNFIKLYDIYKDLLTPNQREIAGMYLNFDLSLSEIALEKGITRSGVSECLKTCKNSFLEFEAKLHILENKNTLAVRDELLIADLTALKRLISPDEIHQRLTEILDTNYLLEAEQKIKQV